MMKTHSKVIWHYIFVTAFRGKKEWKPQLRKWQMVWKIQMFQERFMELEMVAVLNDVLDNTESQFEICLPLSFFLHVLFFFYCLFSISSLSSPPSLLYSSLISPTTYIYAYMYIYIVLTFSSWIPDGIAILLFALACITWPWSKHERIRS